MIKLDYDIATGLVRDLKISSKGDFFDEFKPSLTGDNRASRCEMLLHEVGHAKSLGVKVKPYFDCAIQWRLETVAPLRSDRWNEAYVLASEYLIYAQTDTPISMPSLRNTAREQGVDGAQIRRALQALRTRALAASVCVWLREHNVLSGTYCFKNV